LSDLKVVEIGGPPGAFAAMMLADHGADVLKVIRGGAIPGGEQPTISRAASANPLGRGRRAIALDLRAPGGAERFLRLIDEADALIEGYRPGVMERLGVGPAQCLAQNPRLIYGRMTGWGQEGPWAQLGGHDLTYGALSGVLNAIGERDGPPVMPINILGDWVGGLLMAFGILAARNQVARTMKGVVVDAAMLDAATLMGAIPHAMWSIGGWEAKRASNMTDGGWPFYAIYPTADGRYVAVGAIEPQFYASLIERLGLSDEDLGAQQDRSGWDHMRQRFAEVFLTRTRDEWVEIMAGADACFAPVLDFGEARHHPHNLARHLFVDYGGIEQPAPAPRFDGEISPIRDWHDCDVEPERTLRDWGLSEAETEEFLRA
jgi:alpha-methylacyl-CoA racemase